MSPAKSLRNEKGTVSLKNVIITGGSRGIGAACVREFVKEGCRVFFTYKSNEKKAAALSEETGAIAVRADVSSFSDMERFADVVHKYGTADVIINNAGIAQIKMFQDITEKDWDDMFSVNIKGMFVTVKTFISDLINKKSGRIINISSMWGEEGASCEVHYSATKAAVIGFTKALAKELGPSGITVNSVSPGVIETDMNARLSDEELSYLAEETPAGRMGTPEETAMAICFLASDKSGFITGADIPVNGGFVM